MSYIVFRIYAHGHSLVMAGFPGSGERGSSFQHGLLPNHQCSFIFPGPSNLNYTDANQELNTRQFHINHLDTHLSVCSHPCRLTQCFVSAAQPGKSQIPVLAQAPHVMLVHQNLASLQKGDKRHQSLIQESSVLFSKETLPRPATPTG